MTQQTQTNPRDTDCPVSLHAMSPGDAPRGRAIAERYGFPFQEDFARPGKYMLVLTGDILQLRCNPTFFPQFSSMGSLHTDFIHGTYGYRRQHSRGRSELLLQAVGRPQRTEKQKLFDATAGLGKDGFLLAAGGWEVTMTERSPVMMALLENGLQRALASPVTREIATRTHLRFGDSATILAGLKTNEFPDVISLDPMFPARTKKALVKKEMQIVKQLLGADLDADQLLDIALSRAKNRVVVKRPRYAPFLADKKPVRSVTGKSSRFDIYIPARQI